MTRGLEDLCVEGGGRDPVAERGLNVKNSAAMPRLAWDNNERSKNKKLLIASRGSGEGLIFVKDLLIIAHHLLGVSGIAVVVPVQAGFHPRAEGFGVALGIAAVPGEGPSDIAVAEIVPLNG